MLQSNTVVPLYKQLMEKLKKEITTGLYKPGEQLPPEIEMAKLHQVSVITVRKAVSELVEMGLVEKKQGKGTFVSERKYARDYTRITSFTDSCAAMGMTAGSKTLETRLVTAPAKIYERLQIPGDGLLVYIKRLRYVNEAPMIIEENYFDRQYDFLLDEDFDSEGNSLFNALKARRNIQITDSSKQIEICHATPAQAKLLELPRNNPLLLVNSTAFGANGEIVYAGIQYINGERFALYV